MRYLFPALGAAVALAGVDKLVGQRGYARMFGHLGWTEDQMKAVAVAETAGGLLMLASATRRLGGAVVSAASLAVLSSEMRHGDPNLAGPRALLLLAAVAAAISP